MTERKTISCRAEYEEYLGAFNAGNYDAQIAYYADDVEYKVGTLTISCPQDIKDFYTDFHRHSTEHVGLRYFALTGDTLAVAVRTRFEPFADYRKHGLEFRADEPREIVSLAFYKLKNGQIHRIRMARYAGDLADFD